MHSRVVSALARELASQDLLVLRFNFRGVGESQGVFDERKGALADVAGAVDALAAHEEADASRLALIGYSFGAQVALQHALTDPRIAALVAVALPLVHRGAPDLACELPPILLIAGEHDHLCPPERLQTFADALGRQARATLIRAADHFLVGHEAAVGKLGTGFVRSHLRTAEEGPA
jgi:alpha/beta superfamily hydrolase